MLLLKFLFEFLDDRMLYIFGIIKEFKGEF